MMIYPFLSKQGVISYIVAGNDLKAVIIDPSYDMAQDMIKFIEQKSLQISHVLETHTHADFFSAKDLYKSLYPDIRIGLSKNSHTLKKNLSLQDQDSLQFFGFQITVLETPGHTNDSLTYYVESDNIKTLFTGDTLLIGGTGRTDFQEGSSSSLYDSLHKLSGFVDSTILHPNHNYKGQVATTLGVEKVTNQRLMYVLNNQKQTFIDIMDNHTPLQPDLFHLAVPYNSQ